MWHLVMHKDPSNPRQAKDVGPGSGILSRVFLSEDKIKQVMPGTDTLEQIDVVELGVGDRFVWHEEIRQVVSILTTTDPIL